MRLIMRFQVIAQFVVISVVSICAAQTPPADDLARFRQLLDDVDQFWTDPGEEQIDPEGKNACEKVRGFQQRLAKINRAAIDSAELDNLEVLSRWIEEDSLGCDFVAMRWPIGPFWGIHRYIASMGRSTPLSNIEDCSAYVKHVSQVSDSIELAIAQLKIRIAEGYVPPRCTMQDVPAEIQILLDGRLDELQYPFSVAWEQLPAAERDRLWQQFIQVQVPRLRAALEKLNTFLKEEYIPACRATVAVRDLPRGDEYYRQMLRTLGDTELPPEEVQLLGASEVQRLWRELIAAIRVTPFCAQNPEFKNFSDQQLFDRFRDHLRADAPHKLANEDAVLREYQHVCKVVDHWLPQFFQRLPQLPLGVIPNPNVGREGGVVGYRLGNLKRSMASVLTVDLSNLAEHPIYFIKPYALHEGSPGHHLQLALASENEKLRPFRRSLWFVAFGEGWALYAESLGSEMQLKLDPYDRFGFLHSEMHRACRLALDPAIHWLGWSKEQAADFLKRHTVFSDEFIDQEINRYIALPGQATAYKIGELKIRELREKAEKELRGKFDLREFHDVVLSAGAVPLTVLERRVNEWIERSTR